MFETFTNFFGNVKSFFQRGYDWVAEQAHDVKEYVVGGAKTIFATPGNIVKTVYTDAKSVVTGLNEDINKVLDRGTHTIDNLVNRGGEVIKSGQQVIGSTVSNTAQSLSMPLVIGGLALFGILVLKK